MSKQFPSSVSLPTMTALEPRQLFASYTVTEVFPGAVRSVGRQVTDDGIVVGASFTGVGGTPFFWRPETGATEFAQGTNFWPYDTNNKGVVLGNFRSSNGYVYGTYDVKTNTLTPAPSIVGSRITLVAINDSGQMAGTRDSTLHQKNVAVRITGQTVEEFLMPDQTQAAVVAAINNHGDMIGIYQRGVNGTPFLVRGTTPQALPSAFGGYTQLSDINDAGQISGKGYNPASGSEDAFRWDDTGYTNLNLVTGSGYGTAAINEWGQIVGDRAGGYVTTGTSTQYLDDVIDKALGVTGSYSFFEDINDAGQIVGSVSVPGQFSRAILLTPNADATLTNSTLRIRGGVADDTILLKREGANLNLYNRVGKTHSFPVSGVSKIIIETFGGNDQITATVGNIPVEVLAGTGHDTVVTGAGNDRVMGGTGDDVIRTNAGNDTVNGQDGNDQIFAGAGNDQLYGGAGSDTLTGGTGIDFMSGGLGNDRLLSRDSTRDSVFGDAGFDVGIVDNPLDLRSSVESLLA